MKSLSPEGQIKKDVIDHLTLTGRFFLKLQSGKIKTGGNRYVQMCEIGTPDIVVFGSSLVDIAKPNGINYNALKTSKKNHTSSTFGSKVIWLELKQPKGKQSPEQVAFEAKALAMGHRYAVCRSVEQVIEALT